MNPSADGGTLWATLRFHSIFTPKAWHKPEACAASYRSHAMRLLVHCAAGVIGVFASAALAQEAMYTTAATMPSPHTFVYKPMVHYWRFGSNPNNTDTGTDRYETSHNLAYGLDRGWAAYLDIPAHIDISKQTGGGDETDAEIEQVEASVKYRFTQNDSGGINTVRAAAVFGANLAVDGDFALNPKVGGVVTIVQGKHGFNQDLFFTLNTGGDREDNYGGDGPDDAISHSSAYVYRVWPDAFKSDSRGAWYTTFELSGLYETGGDYELRWAPGLMYEGYRWAFEVMAQLPVYQDVHDRPELDWGVGFGFRFSF